MDTHIDCSPPPPLTPQDSRSPARPIMAMARNYVARPNTDELTVNANVLVHVVDNASDDRQWALVRPVDQDTTGYVPRHFLVHATKVMVAPPPHPPDSIQHDPCIHTTVHAPRPFLRLNQRTRSLSRRLINTPYKLYSGTTRTDSPACTLHVAIQSASHMPILDQDGRHAVVDAAVRVALLSQGKLASNVHKVPATIKQGKAGTAKWTFGTTTPNRPLLSSTKYTDDKLFIRVDPRQHNVAVVFELVYRFSSGKHQHQYVSMGWATLNVFTHPGQLVSAHQYQLPIRTKSPTHLDALPVMGHQSPKPAMISIQVTRLPGKWVPMAQSLPMPVISSLASLPLLATIQAAWTTDMGSTDKYLSHLPHYPPSSDPFLAWIVTVIDDEHSLPQLCELWRREHTKLAGHQRRDVMAAPDSLLRLVAAAWCADVHGWVRGRRYSGSVPVPGPARTSGLKDGGGTVQLSRPFTTQEVKVWMNQ